MFLAHPTLSPLLRHFSFLVTFTDILSVRHVTASLSKVAVLCADPKAELSHFFFQMAHLLLARGGVDRHELGKAAGEEAGEEEAGK